jgi:hypothetical protein
MVKLPDVKEYSDQELLHIWENQNDYTPQMVSLVQQEVDRRGLDVSGVHVRTVEEVNEEHAVASDRNTVKLVVLGNVLVGTVCVMAGVLTLSEELSDTWGSPDFTLPVVLFVFGAILLAFAVGVRREIKWVLLVATIFYAVAAIWNTVALILYLSAYLLGPARSSVSPVFLLSSAVAALVSFLFASACYRLRKARMAGTDTSAG